MKTAIGFIVCFLGTTLLAQPTTAPATETLMKGDIVFTIPDGWKFDGKANSGLLAKLSRTDPMAALVVNVNVQTAVLPDSAAPKIAQSLAKGIKDHADKGDFELVTQPKTEPDDRFFLRLHHKFKKGELVGDEIQIIRVIGLDLVTVAATAFTDNPDEAKQVFDDAAKTLMSVKTAKQAAVGTPSHGAVSKAKPATRPTALP